MMVYKLKDIVILNINAVHHWCITWTMSKNDAIDRLNNSRLDDKGSLKIIAYRIWTLVQTKHLLK